MIGARRKNRLFQCRCMYAFGSSTPIANTPIARTTRVNSRVIVLVVRRSPLPQLLGSKIFAPYGPVAGQDWKKDDRVATTHLSPPQTQMPSMLLQYITGNGVRITLMSPRSSAYLFSDEQREHAKLKAKVSPPCTLGLSRDSQRPQSLRALHRLYAVLKPRTVARCQLKPEAKRLRTHRMKPHGC